MRKSIKILSLIVIIGIVLAVVIPSYTYVPPERRAASELVYASYGVKKEITDNIKSTLSTFGSGDNVKLLNTQHEEFGEFTWEVSTEGVITGQSRKYNLLFTLTPDLIGENVEWTCVFEPNKYAPVTCR
jgi:Tfp pilus assembly major pilin PilA